MGWEVGVFSQQLNVAGLFRPSAFLSSSYYPQEFSPLYTQAVQRNGLRLQLPIAVAVEKRNEFQLPAFRVLMAEAKAEVDYWEPHDGEDELLQYNFQVGLQRGKLSAANGLWIWMVRAGMRMGVNTPSAASYYGFAGILKVKSNLLNKKGRRYYGLAVTYSGTRFLPVPLWGGRHRFSKQVKFDWLLPVNLKLNVDPTKRLRFSVEGRIGQWQWRNVRLYQEERHLRYSYAQASLETQVKIGKRWRTYLEGGVEFPTLKGIDIDQLLPSPRQVYFATLAVRYSLGGAPMDAYFD